MLVPTAADRVLVRFDGYGPEYDQEAPLDRVRAAPAPGGPAGPELSEPPANEAAGASPSEKPAFSAGERVAVAHRGAHHVAEVLGPAGGTAC